MSFKKKLNVLFDGEILLSGLSSNSSRSGIFVASYEILRALVARNDVRIVIWCATDEMKVRIRKLLDQDAFLRRLNVYCPKSFGALRDIYDKLADSKIPPVEKQGKNTRILWSTFRLHRNLWMRFIGALLRSGESGQKRKIESFDAYLSPVFLAPQEIRDSSLPRFTIIYDAIPMLFPEFYTHETAEMWTSVLAKKMTRADHAFAISECTKRDFLKFSPGLMEKHVEVIPLGASDLFYPCDDRARISDTLKKYKIPANKPYFLSLCSLEPRKNLPTVLKAFATFARSDRNSILVLAGAGWASYEKRFEAALASVSAVRNRIFTPGYIADEDLAPLYAGATAFVYSSLYEGFGLPPLEAMKCHIPVLCSNVSSLPEVVGDAAVTFVPDDDKALALAMKKVVEDSCFRNSLIQKGCARTEMFTWSRAADCIVGGMSRVLNDSSRRRSKRVLFDASILQQGIGNGTRSGIFTVTVELLRQFREYGDLEIEFFTSDMSEHMVKQYQKSVDYLTDIRWLDDDAINLRSSAYLRRRYDACFSPVFAFPDWIRKSGLPRYIILYDTIPLLFPDLYPHAPGSLWVEQVIDSLTSEDFGFAISQSAKSDFRKFTQRLDYSKVDVIPLAASDRFSICSDAKRLEDVRKKYGIPKDKPYFLSLSSLEPRKNLVFTIQAFAEFAKGNKDVVLVLAGKAWSSYEDVMSNAVKDAGGVSSRIILTGYVDDEDLSPLYSGAIAFVFLSLYEGFGLPPLEAMQCGTPVLSSNASSLPEVVGDAALTISPNDLDGAVSSMARLASDAGLRNRLRSQGLERAKLFKWSRAAEIIAQRIFECPQLESIDSLDLQDAPLLDRMQISRPLMRFADGSVAVSKGDVLYGPYLKLSAGRYELVLHTSLKCPCNVSITAEAGKRTIKTACLANGMSQVAFELTQAMSNVEFVICNNENTPVVIHKIEIERARTILERMSVSRTDMRSAEGFVTVSKGDVLYGPYMKLPAGRYEMTVDARLEGACVMSLTAEAGKRSIRTACLGNGMTQIDFGLPTEMSNVEFVVSNSEDRPVVIRKVEIERVKPLLDQMSVSRPSMRSAQGIVTISKGDVLYGPYVKLPVGKYEIAVDAELKGQGEIRVTANAGAILVGAAALSSGRTSVSFSSTNDLEKVEFVVSNNDASQIVIRSIEFTRLPD